MEFEGKVQTRHIGRQIARMRELLGVKQDVMADKLGISQQAISKIEQSEHVEEATLDRIAKVLGVSSDTIKTLNDEQVIYNIQNNYEGSHLNMSPNYQLNNQCTFNPIEKLVEALEENKKLYEALLKSEREKVAMLERMLENRKIEKD